MEYWLAVFLIFWTGAVTGVWNQILEAYKWTVSTVLLSFKKPDPRPEREVVTVIPGTQAVN